jgi:glutaredoxin 3
MFCGQAKEYLSQKNIQFEDRAITKDATALEELKKLGYMTTPVLVIGASVIVGFDAAKIDTALRSLHS